jgi:peptidyl-prolyl cis-trans isomerase D
MAASAGKSISRFFVWIILGLLFVALAGFGIGSFGGGASRLGEVGETEITAQDYARALQNEIRAQIAQTQTPVNLADLRAQGLDEAVLQALVARAALANEAQSLGLSVGDAEWRAPDPATRGVSGRRRVLRPRGLRVRSGARGPRPPRVRGGHARGHRPRASANRHRGRHPPPQIYADSIAAFQGETRDLSILTLTEADLADPLPEPTAEELQAYYDDFPDRFERPEARRITYAWLIPAQIMDDGRGGRGRAAAALRRPHRHLPPARAAASGAAGLRLRGGGAGRLRRDRGRRDRFRHAGRGTRPDARDIDLGEVAVDDLPAEAAEVIFADTESEIIGPLPSASAPRSTG